jgi:transposase
MTPRVTFTTRADTRVDIHRRDREASDAFGESGIRFFEEGGGKRSAARHFRISPSAAVKIINRWLASGRIAPTSRGRLRGRGKLAGELGYLRARLAERPDLTMPELADKLARDRGITVDPASVSRFLCRNGITYKKRR